MVKKASATKFPAARIKKLIQADEDVGKVAQATPVVVSKTLELFLQALVAECVKDAQARNTTKISAWGLKRTVTQTPMFDFCADLVADVADPIDGGEDGEPKKKRAPRKPKKKVEEEEYDDEDGKAPAGAPTLDDLAPAAETKATDDDEDYD